MTIASKALITAADILSVQAKALVAEADAVHAQQTANAALALAQQGSGVSGSVWREGNGPPGLVGIAGDFYLDGLTGDVYMRGISSYSVVCNIKGIPGTPGGPQGPPGVGVVSGAINGAGHLIITKTDGSAFDAGLLPTNVITLASLPQTGAFNGQFIQWNGSQWSPGSVSITLGQLPQTGAGTGQGMIWNGTTWAPGNVAATLAGLPQTGAVTGQAIVWNGSIWAPGTVSGGGGGGSGPITVPSGATGVLDNNAVLTFTYSNGDTATFTGSYSSGPPVLPPGVAPHSLSVINVAPGTIWPNVGTALLGLADNGTINVAAGTYRQSWGAERSDFPTGITINGAGAYLTIFDGQFGIGNGHRLYHGKGVGWFNGNFHINNCGFINGGGADHVSDGEAGLYMDENVGTGYVNRCAFNNNENGIFANNATFLGGGHLYISDCDFGKNLSNGTAGDGAGHDNYLQCDFINITNSRYYGCKDGHNVKIRNIHATFTSSGNYFRRDQGRCMDFAYGSTNAFASTGDTFTNTTNANTNIMAYADEDGIAGYAGGTYTGLHYDQGRFDAVIWNNSSGSTVTFSSIIQTWFTASPASTLNLQGPGSITGISTTVGTVNTSGIAPPTSTL